MESDLTEKADGQERGSDDYMESVETGGYKEGCSVNTVGDSKGGFIVFHSLEEGEVEA